MEDRPPSHRICKLPGYTRDRRGCRTCRRRKKKCDLEGQRCRQCIRLNLACVWDEERRLSSPAVALDGDEATDTERTADVRSDTTLLHLSPTAEHGNFALLQPRASLTLYQPSCIPLRNDGLETQLVSTHRRNAIRYYVQDFAGTLSTTEENNGFLSVLLPMAMESHPLMDVLVAWSTSHLALRQEIMSVKALEDRSLALRSFASCLQDLGPEIVLAICLILISMEAILGSTQDWHHHLSAAANIIRSTLSEHMPGILTSSLASSSEGRWLLRNFAYHDILASISLDRDLLIPGLDWQGQAGCDVVDTYLGLASAPMALLGQIQVLSRDLICAAESSEGSAEEPVTAGMAQRLLDLENKLFEWRMESGKGQHLTAMAESYRSAALIHLYRVARYHKLVPILQLETKIAHQVDVVIRCVAQMPVGCLPECTLLFPLYMAGGETYDVEYQAIVGKRLEAIANQRHFANASTALDVLREVWDVRSQTMPLDASRPYDWHGVLKRRKWSLALS